jgi:hypothetical protein
LKDAKQSFFETDAPAAATDDTVYHISKAIVDVVIGQLLFNADDEAVEQGATAPVLPFTSETAPRQPTLWPTALPVLGSRRAPPTPAQLKQNALKLFRPNSPDGDYTVTIANSLRFELAVQYVALGMSFRQVARAIGETQRLTKLAKLRGLTASMVGQYARVLVGSGLQKLADILQRDDVWSFALAFDGSMHRETSYFDVRVRLAISGVLCNLHLVVLPQFDRHTANNQVQLLVTLMDAVIPCWREKLIGISTDGENTNTGRLRGVVTQLVAMAKYPVRILFFLAQCSCAIRSFEFGACRTRWTSGSRKRQRPSKRARGSPVFTKFQYIFATS